MTKHVLQHRFYDQNHYLCLMLSTMFSDFHQNHAHNGLVYSV